MFHVRCRLVSSLRSSLLFCVYYRIVPGVLLRLVDFIVRALVGGELNFCVISASFCAMQNKAQ